MWCQAIEMRRKSELIRCAVAAHTTELSLGQGGLQDILSTEEMFRWQGIPAQRRRDSYSAGRRLAKAALAELTGAFDPKTVNITSGVFGQPVVAGEIAPGWSVSISHCERGAVAVAFPLGHPMSVDVEVRADAEHTDMDEHFVPEELRQVTSAGVAPDAIKSVLWTAKEALGKVLHCGLTVPLQIFKIASIEGTEDLAFDLRFENFVQYKCLVWMQREMTIALALPARTEIEPLRQCWAQAFRSY